MKSRSSQVLRRASLVVACIALVSDASGAVNWRSNIDAAKIEAAQSNRFLLLHFWSPSCGPCKLLDKNVFSHPPLGAALEQNFVPVKINTEVWRAITDAYRVEVVPTEIILTPQGEELARPRIPNSPNEYVSQLNSLAAHFRRSAAPPTAQPPQINQAYASLPISSGNVVNQVSVDSQQGLAGQALTSNQHATSPIGSSSAPSGFAGNVPQVGSLATPGAPYANAVPDRYASPNSTPPSAGVVQHAPGVAGPGPVGQNPYFDTPTTGPSSPPTTPNASAATSAAAEAQTSPSTPAATGYQAATTEAATQGGHGDAQTPSVAPTTASVDQTANATTPTPRDPVPVGMDGFCPVTVQTARKWVKGSPTIQIEHRGRTYRFAGKSEREQFLANPDKFSPVFNGLDPVLLIENREAVEGTRRFGYEYRGAVYLFSSKETMEKFGASKESADYYSGLVYEAMRRLDASGGTLRR